MEEINRWGLGVSIPNWRVLVVTRTNVIYLLLSLTLRATRRAQPNGLHKLKQTTSQKHRISRRLYAKFFSPSTKTVLTFS